MRGTLSTLSGLICAIVESMGQGIFTFRKKSGKNQGI